MTLNSVAQKKKLFKLVSVKHGKSTKIGTVKRMTVYVDNAYITAAVNYRGRKLKSKWCHLTADTTEELDAFAKKIGLKVQWRQHSGTWKEHYDLTEARRVKAVKAGAVEISWKQQVKFLQQKKINSQT